jgi:hypothetical protein
MSDLARLRIWDDPAIRGALSWYLDVAENRRPAKFRIAATVATGLHLVESSEDALWAELDRLTPIFLARWQAIRAGAPLPQAVDGPSVLELCTRFSPGMQPRDVIRNKSIRRSVGVLSENPIRLRIRVARSNRRMIDADVRNPLLAWDVLRRLVQVAQPA